MGWMTEETGALVSIWRQANVQNELDAVARVVSSPREVLVPSRLSSISEDSMGPIFATVNMQFTAEEKQQAALRISH